MTSRPPSRPGFDIFQTFIEDNLTSLENALNISSNAANTLPILTLTNTAGNFQTFRGEGSPEGVITANVGDLYIDSTNGLKYIKHTGAGTDTGWTISGGLSSFKSYTFVSRAVGTGAHYIGGFYDAPAADATLTIGGTVTQTHGGANHPYGAHAFAVASGAGGTDLVLTVSGTSIGDDGTRTGSDTEIIVADTDAASTDQYFETAKKWIGQITYTLTGSSGAFTFNYGFAKYEDFGNKDFAVTDFETVGLANSNDASFNVELLHHKTTGWTYSAAAFVAGTTALLDLNTIYSTEQDLDSGEDFAFKRSAMNTSVAGATVEGVLTRITIGANNSVTFMNVHIGVQIR